ncbi:MAG TPA: DUF1992 domain-containing protein [Tepidiformaceae bacterium]|nr:DUF1992 domain-containing protein [Tepidiformaceae bacterium]
MSYGRLVEDRIRAAQEKGAFDNLQGHGQPLDLDEKKDALAGDNWLGYRMLRNANMLPAWLELARDIERQRKDLARLDARHEALAAHARHTAQLERYATAIASARAQYEAAARALRRDQDRYNLDAPAIGLERPGIWVEHELARLDARVTA